MADTEPVNQYAQFRHLDMIMIDSSKAIGSDDQRCII